MRSTAAREPDGALPDGVADGAAARQAASRAMRRRRDKLVQVDRIVMDSDAVEAAAGMDLGANSKLDRDPRLKDALCEHGRLQARRYRTLRRQVGRLCGELGATLAGACGSTAGIDPDTADGGACRPAAGRGALVLDGVTLYGTGKAGADVPRALARWRTVDAELGGRPVRIEGRSELADDLDAGSEWRVKEVKLTSVAPARGSGGREADAQAQASYGRQMAPGSSRTQ